MLFVNTIAAMDISRTTLAGDEMLITSRPQRRSPHLPPHNTNAGASPPRGFNVTISVRSRAAPLPACRHGTCHRKALDEYEPSKVSRLPGLCNFIPSGVQPLHSLSFRCPLLKSSFGELAY
ncbi:hypothetical protein DPSP01_006559 [Paraphaeosphaeria sporulosa]